MAQGVFVSSLPGWSVGRSVTKSQWSVGRLVIKAAPTSHTVARRLTSGASYGSSAGRQCLAGSVQFSSVQFSSVRHGEERRGGGVAHGPYRLVVRRAPLLLAGLVVFPL